MSSAADPTAAFFANLRSSGLIPAPQLQELWRWVTGTRPDVQGLAKEISRRGWLTAFQIKEVFRGRGRDLTLAGRYVLLDLLGEGGMGRVYKAQDVRMGKAVAVKVIRQDKLTHPAAAARFQQEIEALGQMNHPNVVDVYDADLGADTHFYAMEYIDGTDLTKMVRDQGPLPVPEACEYIRQAALGLQHASEKGLVHRDVKPSNILVSRNGRVVKVVDLGLARLMENEAPGGEDGHRITQDGYVIGTPDFLAPEQARNPKGVDIRADVYALGGTLYYILTGKVPFDGSNPTEKLVRHCTDPPPSLLARRPDAPPQVEQIIHWCMAKAPEARPQTPLQLALALQPYCPPPAQASGRFALPNAQPTARHPATTATHVPMPPGTRAYPPAPGGAPHAPAAAPLAYPPPARAAQPPAGRAGPPPAAPAPPAYPQPSPFAFPVDEPQPGRSSQVFKLPPQTTDADPIRRRAAGGFPWGLVLIGLGGLFVVGLLGWAVYVQFVQPDGPPLETFTNSQGMKMVLLDGGAFRMGSPKDEPGRRDDEGPQHEVRVSGPLFVSATEVSHSQYSKVMGGNPSRAGGLAHRAHALPVDSVTWAEANEFCRKLTEAEKGQPWARRGWAYRLPTEAEWEYACRAGTDGPFAFGPQVIAEKQAMFRFDTDDPLGLGDETGKRPLFPQEVGKTDANRFGLHDVHGNVAEWCSDWYKPGYPGDGPRADPTGPADGDKRVVRGGSFKDTASAARSAARGAVRPSDRRQDVGFRVVYAPTR